MRPDRRLTSTQSGQFYACPPVKVQDFLDQPFPFALMYPMTDLKGIRFAIPNKVVEHVCRMAGFKPLFPLLSAVSSALASGLASALASAIDSRTLRPYVGRFKTTSLPGLPSTSEASSSVWRSSSLTPAVWGQAPLRAGPFWNSQTFRRPAGDFRHSAVQLENKPQTNPK